MISIRSGKVDGQELPLIAPADGTKYLGVKVNNWTGVPKKTQAKNLNSGRQSPPQIQAKVGNAKPVCNREATILFVPSRNPSMQTAENGPNCKTICQKMVETVGMCYEPHPIRRDQKGWTESPKAEFIGSL